MKVSKNKIIPFLVSVLLFFNIQPYFLWSLLTYSYVKLGLIMLTLGLLWINKRRFTNLDIKMFLFFLFTLFLMAILNGLNVFGITSTVVLVIIPFVSPVFMNKAYVYFKEIYSVIILLSMVVMVLILSGVNIPNHIISPLNPLKIYDYTAYPFLVIPNTGIQAITGIGRFTGPFDEPGVIGTVSLLILYIEKFNLKKWQNIVMLISGIISFSLFFYIASFVYGTYYVLVHKTKFIYRVAVISGLAMFIVLNFDNITFSEYIWQRVEWNEKTSSISGDNRTHNDLESYFESIQGTSIYYWGLGLVDRKLLSSFDGSAGYKNAILRYGLIGCSLYLLFFFMFAYQKIENRRLLSLFIILFLFTLYQRPAPFSIHYLYLFTMFILLNSKREQTIPGQPEDKQKLKVQTPL